MRHDGTARSVVAALVVAALVAGALVVGALALAGGGSSPGQRRGEAGAGRLAVVATTTQLADFARVVGGTGVAVIGLLKANVDAHDYEPSPVDLEALRNAAVVVRNGVGLDPWLDDALDAAGSHAVVVDASLGVVLRQSEHGAPGDPHIWQDPHNARRMVGTITAALDRAAPNSAALFDANRTAYDGELLRLDADIAGELASIANRDVVTNHDAFGYFCDRYGLHVVGSVIPSFDSQAELSAREVTTLVAKIRAAHVTAVFSETSLPAKAAAAIARDAHVRVVQGDGALYGDSLGPRGSDGDTYLTMMRHNARTLAANLGGGR